MSKKIAIIKPKLSILQLIIVKEIKDIDFFELNQIDVVQQNSNIQTYLQGAVEQLHKQQFVKQNSVVINYISNVNPIQITFSVQCEYNDFILKELQSCLLQNKFLLRIIL